MYSLKGLALGLGCSMLIGAMTPAAVLAKAELPVKSFSMSDFIKTDNFMPSCIDGGSCAVFVDSKNGNDDNDGTKDKPMKTIKKALTKTTSNKYIIALAEGTYDGGTGEDFPLTFSSKRYLLGGFYDSFKKRDNSRNNHKTVLNLSEKGTNLKKETGLIISSGSVVVDGIEFREGRLFVGSNSDSGGAIQIDAQGEVLVSNSSFVSNQAKKGGAIAAYAEDSSSLVLLAGNDFKSNKATTVSGGGVYAKGNVVIFDNTFEKNTSGFDGGAVYALENTKVIANRFWKNNESSIDNTGGAVAAEGRSKVYNNFFHSNGTDATVYVNGNAEFIHNTVVGSKENGVEIGGSLVKVVNNLVVDSGKAAIAPTTISLSGFTAEGNAYFESNSVSLIGKECDPKFADKAAQDPEKLKITQGSKCIDLSSNYGGLNKISELARDYFGGERNLDGNKDGKFGADPGAHEIEGSKATDAAKPELKGLSITGDKDPVVVKFEITENATVSVEIHDSSAKLVKKIAVSQTKTKGKLEFKWDQKAEGGKEKVKYGTYTVKIKAANSGGVADVSKNFELTKPTATTTETKTEGEKKNETKTETKTPVANNGKFEKCAGFSDVVSGSRLCPAVIKMKEKGVFKGYEDGTFGYDRPISRAEVLKVAFVLFGRDILESDGSDLGFKDLADRKSAWYMKYIRTAKEFKIMKGYDDGTFKPDRPVLRNEFLKIFFLTSKMNFDYSDQVAPYADVPVSDGTKWFLNYVRYVRDHNLMDVDNAGNFGPSKPMTRGDVAEFITRFVNKGLLK